MGPFHKLQLDHLLRSRAALLRLQELARDRGCILDHCECQRDHELQEQDELPKASRFRELLLPHQLLVETTTVTQLERP